MTTLELQELRRTLGLTQVQLAAAVGVQPSTVSRWEQGARPITALAATALRGLALEHRLGVDANRRAPTPRRSAAVRRRRGG